MSELTEILMRQRALRNPTPDERRQVLISELQGRGFMGQGLPEPGTSEAFDEMNTLQKIGMSPVGFPVTDVAGVLGDIQMMKENPELRTLDNAFMTAFGALPFVPSMAGMKAAIRTKAGKVFTGNSHAQALLEAQKSGEKVLNKKGDLDIEAELFETDAGDLISRQQAMTKFGSVSSEGLAAKGLITPVERALAKVPTSNTPVMSQLNRRGDIIFVEFDNASRVPGADELKELLGAKADVTKFKQELLGKTRGSTRFRIDVEGEKEAQRLLDDVFGGRQFLSNTTKTRSVN